MIRTAVILAAGRGVRLGPLGRRIPKGCIQIAPGGPTIVEESVALLRSRGITRVVIVTGHLHEFYEELVSGPLRGIAATVHNRSFAASGSMDSLVCASQVLDDDFLLLESDLVYEPRAIDAALDSSRADVVVLSGPTGSGDEVYVELLGATIGRISKDRASLNHATAELVGITRISTELYARMLAFAQTHANTEYESGALTAIARNYLIYHALVPDLVWAEIDTPAHLRRVRRDVYPTLRRIERTSAAARATG